MIQFLNAYYTFVCTHAFVLITDLRGARSPMRGYNLRVRTHRWIARISLDLSLSLAHANQLSRSPILRRSAVVNVPFDCSTLRSTTIDQEIKANATVHEIDRFSIATDNDRFRDPLMTPPFARIRR